MTVVESGSCIDAKYETVRLLGDGAIGSVWEARHVLTGARVALKILFPEFSRTDAHVERFLREASASNEIGHPGIVRVLDAGIDPETGQMYLAMELLHGETLRDLMERPDTTCLAVLDHLLAALPALCAAHDAGYVHRDLKPDNLFVTLDGRVKILDLGMVRPMGAKSATASGIAVGTPWYMSPEQAMRPASVGPAADVWSMGVIAYEALAGAPPYDGESPHAVIVAAVYEPHAPLASRAPGAPPEMIALVERCLAKEPAGRPETKELLEVLGVTLGRSEVRAALDHPYAKLSVPPPAPTQDEIVPLVHQRPPPTAELVLPERRFPVLPIAALAALLLLVVAGVQLGIRGGSETDEEPTPAGGEMEGSLSERPPIVEAVAGEAASTEIEVEATDTAEAREEPTREEPASADSDAARRLERARTEGRTLEAGPRRVEIASPRESSDPAPDELDEDPQATAVAPATSVAEVEEAAGASGPPTSSTSEEPAPAAPAQRPTSPAPAADPPPRRPPPEEPARAAPPPFSF